MVCRRAAGSGEQLTADGRWLAALLQAAGGRGLSAHWTTTGRRRAAAVGQVAGGCRPWVAAVRGLSLAAGGAGCRGRQAAVGEGCRRCRLSPRVAVGCPRGGVCRPRAAGAGLPPERGLPACMEPPERGCLRRWLPLLLAGGHADGRGRTEMAMHAGVRHGTDEEESATYRLSSRCRRGRGIACGRRACTRDGLGRAEGAVTQGG